MSVKEIKNEEELDDINSIIENIRRIKKRLENLEYEACDLYDNKQERMNKLRKM